MIDHLMTTLIAAGFNDGGCTCGDDARVIQAEPVTGSIHVFGCACGIRVGVELNWATLSIDLVPAPPRVVPCTTCGKFACECQRSTP